MFITIVRRPIGEAPEWVRDAWIGLRLPLADPHKRHRRGFGVLSGPHNIFAQLWALVRGRSIAIAGYMVNAKAAIGLLAEKDPAAARWWRANAPKLLDGRRNFMFDEEACRFEGATVPRTKSSRQHRPQRQKLGE